MTTSCLLYGRGTVAFTTDAVRSLVAAASALDLELLPLAIEDAIAAPARCREFRRVYVFPFDLPESVGADRPDDAIAFLKAQFPRAEFVNGLAAHDLGWDKCLTAQRLLGRGVPVPDTLITNDPKEVHEFVVRHDHAVLRERTGCGGHGAMVLFRDGERNLVGETSRKPYFLDLRAEAVAPGISAGVLTLPPPFFVQRLVANVDGNGVLSPASLLRAFIVDGRTAFWLELYRDQARRPGEFIVSPTTGGRYRFWHHVSEEAHKLAMRAAEVIGVRVGCVDLVRGGGQGPFVLEVRSDGRHMFIDRGFTALPEWRSPFDFDTAIAELLATPVDEPQVRRTVPLSQESK